MRRLHVEPALTRIDLRARGPSPMQCKDTVPSGGFMRPMQASSVPRTAWHHCAKPLIHYMYAEYKVTMTTAAPIGSWLMTSPGSRKDYLWSRIDQSGHIPTVPWQPGRS